MLHIRPVLEKDASAKVQEVYADIKDTLHIHFVPLLFQYIAGFEDYFVYSWGKVKTNILSDYYQKAIDGIIHEARKSVKDIYRESHTMQTFLHCVGCLQ